MASLRDRFRVPAAPVRLAALDVSATPGAPGGKAATLAEVQERAGELFELGERLLADRSRSVLLILQGMDGSGKGGTIKRVVRQLNPNVVQLTAFKTPTQEERAHHFLWRIRRRLPELGRIGVFDRSHYEDVLIVRVHDLVPREVWEKRYDEINAFERELVAGGMTIVKVFLHVSHDEQCRRMRGRLENPTKRWKFNPRDLEERARWDEYVEAYEAVLARCSSDALPWYVVPADRKWYRDWAVQGLLLETLRELDPQYPLREDLDIEALRARLPCT